MTAYTKLKIVTALTASLLCSCPPDVFAAAKHRATGGGTRPSGGGGSTMMQTPNPQNPLEHNNRGVEYGSKGMWTQAVQEHELALAGDPWNLTFRQNLSAAALKFGQSLLAKGDSHGAISKLRFAIYVDPENRAADEYLSTALKKSGKNPDDAKVRKEEAERLDSDGNYVESIAEYKHYVRMTDSGLAHYSLGCVLIKQGSTVPIKTVEGYKELRTAVTKAWETGEKADLSRCHAKLGEILSDFANLAREHGNAEVAMKRLLNSGIEYRRAVMFNPLNTDAIHGLIEVSREAVAVNPSFDNHLMLAGAYQLQPDFEHARREYQECYKLNRNSPVLAQARRSFHYAVVSSSQASQPMLAESMQKIEEQLRNTPSDAELLWIYGRGKEQQGDRESAIHAYEAAAAINQNIHPQLMPRLAALKGGSSIGNKMDVNTAPPPITAAKASEGFGSLKDPGKLGAPPQPGATAQAVGTTPGTTAPGTAATPAKAAATPPADYAAGEGMLKSGNFDGAITAFTNIVDKNPADGHAWFLLASASEKKGDLEAASTDYRQASASPSEKEAQAGLDRVNAARVAPILQEVDKDLAAKNLTGAASALHDAIDLDPKNVSLHHKLLDILKQSGDTKEIEREQKRIDELEKGAK